MSHGNKCTSAEASPGHSPLQTPRRTVSQNTSPPTLVHSGWPACGCLQKVVLGGSGKSHKVTCLFPNPSLQSSLSPIDGCIQPTDELGLLRMVLAT